MAFELGRIANSALPPIDRWPPLWDKYLTTEQVPASTILTVTSIPREGKCRGMNSEGKPCGLKAGADGYCKYHG
jgi:Family of unknown function (DUF5763)